MNRSSYPLFYISMNVKIALSFYDGVISSLRVTKENLEAINANNQHNYIELTFFYLFHETKKVN